MLVDDGSMMVLKGKPETRFLGDGNLLNVQLMIMNLRYRVFMKYCVFSLKFLIYLNSASSGAALEFYLPGVCTHTDTKGKQ